MQVTARGSARRLRRWAWPGSVILLVLALVALAAISGWFAARAHAEQQEKQRRQGILAAARQEALHLSSMSHKTADRDVDRVLQGATGRFEQRFSAQAESIKKMLNKARVVSDGKVREAAIANVDRSSATSLVVVDGKVRNNKNPGGSARLYKYEMTLKQDGGHWRVAQLRILP